VWDKNAIQKNVFIGSVEFHYADILKNLEDFESELNQPQWFGLTNQKKNDQACGDILIKIGFLGYMDSNLKQVVNSFEVSHNAALLSSDDPMDGIYFNHFAFGGIDQTTETETTETAASSKRLSTDSATSSTDSLESRMELLSTKDGVEQPVLVGLLLIKVAGAQNLPLEKSKLKKFNCDPFCVIQFGKKIFRTNLIRHSLNPQWNETVSFHLKKSDISNDWPINWSIYDFERFKKNNQICQINTSLSQIISKCASPLRNPHKPTAYTPVELEFELEVLNQRTVTLGSTPILKIECTFITYTEIRRNFWMALLSQYTSSLPTEVVPMVSNF
jgi:phosphatidylserine decarboxylase